MIDQIAVSSLLPAWRHLEYQCLCCTHVALTLHSCCTSLCYIISLAIVCILIAGEDAVGPQNWYKEAGGQPAQALPKEDVGPHLPPGGQSLIHQPTHSAPCFTLLSCQKYLTTLNACSSCCKTKYSILQHLSSACILPILPQEGRKGLHVRSDKVMSLTAASCIHRLLSTKVLSMSSVASCWPTCFYKDKPNTKHMQVGGQAQVKVAEHKPAKAVQGHQVSIVAVTVACQQSA